MKHRLDHLKKFDIETNDGLKGKVRDFLFDEDTWKVRYIDADFGGFFKDKRVLLPLDALAAPLWEDKHFPLNISRDQIDKSPGLEDKPTVSREYEKEIMKYYGYSAYWGAGYAPPEQAGLYYPARPLTAPAKKIDEENLGTHLRSFKEVEGYHILANDGNLGHVEDMIVDDADWQLTYLIVDTSNWRPWSKKVILLINWLKEISYVSKEVVINTDTETIKNAPEFDTDKPVEEAFEESLLEYYRREFP